MSRNKVQQLDRATRNDLARRIKVLRLERELKQEELAEYASVSRQTIIDIEGNRTVPQAAVLVRILTVLGVDLDAPEFDEQTELWLSMIGSLIESLPEPRRSPTVNRLVRVLSEEIKNATRASVSGPADDEDFDVEFSDVTQKDLALVAKRGTKKVDIPHAE